MRRAASDGSVRASEQAAFLELTGQIVLRERRDVRDASAAARVAHRTDLMLSRTWRATTVPHLFQLRIGQDGALRPRVCPGLGGATDTSAVGQY